MNKKGATSVLMIIGVIALIGILAGVSYAVFFKQQTVLPGASTSGGIVSGVCQTACPDDLTWSGTVQVINPLNSTGEEQYNVTMLFKDADGQVKATQTNTDGSALTLTCGESYIVEAISADGNNGDSARILAGPIVKEGDGLLSDPEDGWKFTACGDGNAIKFKINQRGLPEVRAKDVVNNNFMYDTSDAITTDYETTDGVEFMSITNNVTDTPVGESGEFHVIEYVRATVADNAFNDLGTYVLVDASNSVYNEPTVKIEGATAQEASGMLNADEAIAYNAYEYVYFIPKTLSMTQNNEVSVDLQIFALGGVNPNGANANISIDYATVGKYRSNANSDIVKVGAVQDNPGKTTVYTLHDTVFAIS